MKKVLKFAKRRNLAYDLFYDRVIEDGGTVENTSLAKTFIKSLSGNESLALIPSGKKVGKVYAQVPTDGSGDGTFERDYEATYIDENGVIQTAAADVPRFQDGALLLEPQRTQLYELTDNLVTQTKSVDTDTYTVSFWGTGTITFSGSYSGSLVGVDDNTRVEKTFEATAGSLVSTISGIVKKGQLELGSYATSYIANTTTVSVTRLADFSHSYGTVDTFNSEEGVLFLELSALYKDTQKFITISDNNSSNYIQLRFNSNNSITYRSFSNGTGQTLISDDGSTDISDNNKIALTWGLESALWINGVKVGFTTTSSSPFNLDVLNFANETNTSSYFYGKVKQLKVFKEALDDTTLANLTSL